MARILQNISSLFDNNEINPSFLLSNNTILLMVHIDLRTKKLKRSLEGWRKILLNVHSLILWEKHWYPGVLFGALSLLFFLIWVSDQPVLTTISTLGILITIGDYLVPTAMARIFRNETWTDENEKKFDEICQNMVFYYIQFSTMLASFYWMRTVRPKLYYAVSVGSLLMLAWISSSVNNLLLIYLFLLTVVMLPGLSHQGLLHKYGGCITKKIKSLTKSTTVEKENE